jgi:hypothetical protein
MAVLHNHTAAVRRGRTRRPLRGVHLAPAPARRPRRGGRRAVPGSRRRAEGLDPLHRARARIRFERTGAGIDARELLWGLSVCSEGIKTEPTNLLFCKGGFMEIPESDYTWLCDVMAGRAPSTAKRDS